MKDAPRRSFEEALAILQDWNVLQEIMSLQCGEEIILQREVAIEDGKADFHFVGYVSKRKRTHLKSVPLSARPGHRDHSVRPS